MTTQTSLVAQQVKLQQWAAQIRDCQNRPKGMDVETWCAQNNLTKANYYYRLRRVREMCLTQMQNSSPTFFKMPVTSDVKVPEAIDQTNGDNCTNPVAVIRITNKSGVSAEVFSNVSPEILCSLVEAFHHAE